VCSWCVPNVFSKVFLILTSYNNYIRLHIASILGAEFSEFFSPGYHQTIEVDTASIRPAEFLKRQKKKLSKVLDTVALHSKYTRTLTFQNAWQEPALCGPALWAFFFAKVLFFFAKVLYIVVLHLKCAGVLTYENLSGGNVFYFCFVLWFYTVNVLGYWLLRMCVSKCTRALTFENVCQVRVCTPSTSAGIRPE
jgi:hypothetical protein